MTEEQVTIAIITWLKSNDWKIICFDFPQSGTGIVLHPNSDVRESTKNKGAIIPDIVAVKDKIAIFFENKDRFVLADFEKISAIKSNNFHSDSIDKLLKNYEIDNIFFGVGLPFEHRYLAKVIEHTKLVDFVIFVGKENQILVNYEIIKIFQDE